MIPTIEDALVAEVARDQVEQIAPQEVVIFPMLSEAYFQDPEKTIAARGGKDEMLGFGLEAGAILLTPVILTVTGEVISFIAGEVVKSLQAESSGLIGDFVRKTFKKFRRQGEAKGERLPPPLTQEQLLRVKEIARRKGRQLKLTPTQAELLADSLAGSLATTP